MNPRAAGMRAPLIEGGGRENGNGPFALGHDEMEQQPLRSAALPSLDEHCGEKARGARAQTRAPDMNIRLSASSAYKVAKVPVSHDLHT